MTRPSSTIRPSLVHGCVSLALGLLCLALLTPAASADRASDGRAIFVNRGHVTTCSQVGFRFDKMVASPDGTKASDSNISGTVLTNAVPHRAGGEGLEVSLANSNVIVDAVIVEGGNGYNKYADQSFLPPALGQYQHYVPPLNNWKKLRRIARWFLCYRIAPPTNLPESPSVIALPIAVGVLFSVAWYRHRRRGEAVLVS
jgi:hypothetical protein